MSKMKCVVDQKLNDLQDLIADASGITFSQDLVPYQVAPLSKTEGRESVIEFMSGIYEREDVQAVINELNKVHGSNTARWAEPEDYKSGTITENRRAVVIPTELYKDGACMGLISQALPTASFQVAQVETSSRPLNTPSSIETVNQRVV